MMTWCTVLVQEASRLASDKQKNDACVQLKKVFQEIHFLILQVIHTNRTKQMITIQLSCQLEYSTKEHLYHYFVLFYNAAKWQALPSITN